MPEEEQIKLIAKDFDSTSEPELDVEKIAWKDSNKTEAKKHLGQVISMLNDEKGIMKYAEEMGKGNVLWPLRYALSGQEKSPSPLILIKILGVEESRKRVEKAIELL